MKRLFQRDGPADIGPLWSLRGEASRLADLMETSRYSSRLRLHLPALPRVETRR